MKKILLFAAATAVALSSCSKNEIAELPDSAKTAVGFSTYAGVATKASTTIETAFANDDVFVIDAYYTGTASFNAATSFTSFMQDQTVTASQTTDVADTWTYNPIKYWPNNADDKVSFFAISTGTSTAGSFNDTAVSTTAGAAFTYDNTTTGDLLVASKLNVSETSSAVALSFKHALTQLQFNAYTAADYSDKSSVSGSSTTITITGLDITYKANNFTKSGTFTFSPTTESSVTCSGGTAIDADATVSETFTQAITSTALTSPLYTTTIIPQGTASTEMANVKVTYTVATVDGNSTSNGSTITNTATFSLDKAYASNTIYTYNIVVSLVGVTVSGTISSETSSDSFNVAVETSTPDSTVSDVS